MAWAKAGLQEVPAGGRGDPSPPNGRSHSLRVCTSIPSFARPFRICSFTVFPALFLFTHITGFLAIRRRFSYQNIILNCDSYFFRSLITRFHDRSSGRCCFDIHMLRYPAVTVMWGESHRCCQHHGGSLPEFVRKGSVKYQVLMRTGTGWVGWFSPRPIRGCPDFHFGAPWVKNLILYLLEPYYIIYIIVLYQHRYI